MCVCVCVLFFDDDHTHDVKENKFRYFTKRYDDSPSLDDDLCSTREFKLHGVLA